MNLHNFELDINQTIFKRGEKYYDNGLIENLNTADNGLWNASINGTYIYSAQVKMSKDSIDYWNCDCPYDGGPICKHVVAVLLAIRQNFLQASIPQDVATNITKNTKPLTKKAQLEQILQNTSREELIEYMRKIINEDKTLANKIILQSQMRELKVTAAEFMTSFNTIIKKYSSRGFIDYHASIGFSGETFELLQTLESLDIKAQVRVDACFKILDVMMEKVIEVMDDSNGELAEICIHLSSILAVAFPELNNTQQKRCFQELLFWEFESELYDYGLDHDFEHLAPEWASDKIGLQDLYLQAIDKAQKLTTNAWQKKHISEKKLSQLSAWGRTEEAESYILENIEIPKFRKIIVKEAIAKKDYKTARSLINTGIKLAKKENYHRDESDWRRMLVDIAKQTNDIERVRKELLLMQKDSVFDIELYREIKASYAAQDWPLVQVDYATKMMDKYSRVYSHAEVYAEENQIRELFDLIQSDEYQASHLFKKYLKIIVKEFPEESANFYSIIIHHELEQTGRKVYQQAVQDIKALQKLLMGKEIAKQLIKELVSKYQNRPLMLEIFKKAFAEVK